MSHNSAEQVFKGGNPKFAYPKTGATAFPPGAEIIKTPDGGNYAGGYPKGHAEQVTFPQKTNFVVTLFIRGVW